MTAASLFGGLGRWAWDIDEVASLQELGLDTAGGAGAPDSQLSRLPRLVPVWYWCQSRVLKVLPATEGNTRLVSAFSAFLAVLAAFAASARRHGLAFAGGLALVIDANPLFLALAQQNRFYGTAVLLLVLTGWSVLGGPRNAAASVALTALLAALAVLCHNLLLVVFALGALASAAGFCLGWVSKGVLIRAGVAGCVGVGLYFGHVRPLSAGWNESLPPRPAAVVLASFVSEIGVPTLALALVGAARPREGVFRWWALLAALGLAFVAAGPALIWFNYRYALLFAPPLWVLAARGVRSVGSRLGGGPPSWAWYAAVLLLFAPKWLSHHVDGSRRDFREAARVVAREARPGDPLFCNWRELGYYLPGAEPRGWSPATDFPAGTCYVVTGGNAWDPPIRVAGRVVEVVARVGRRRFDEQSNVVNVLRILPNP